MPEQAPDIEFGRGKLRYDKERRTIVAEGPMDVNSPEATLWSENMRLKSENESLQQRLQERTTERDYHMRVADQLAARVCVLSEAVSVSTATKGEGNV